MNKVNFGIKKIFEDDDILIIFKPAGVLTIPDRFDLEAPNVTDFLKAIYDEVFTVHRLDRDTSGVMVYAKNANSHRNLSLQFQEQKVLKIYHAVVKGIVDKESIDIDIPIAPHPAKQGASIPSARGKASLTIAQTLQRFKNSTLLECKLITGRHHQLRVHVAAIGHPLLIDEVYGSDQPVLVSELKKHFNLKKNSEEKPIISRITMHAYQIGFEHPKSGEHLTFIAEYPKDFRALLQVLNKYASV